MNTQEQNINDNITDTSESVDGTVNGTESASSKSAGGEPRQETAKDPLTELQEKCDMLNDKYLRLYSEFENYRRRTAKEKLDIVRHSGSQIFKELLPVLDDFERAVAANENDQDITSIKEGFKLIHHKLQHILETNGVKVMDVMEKPFDTSYHEAITNIPAPRSDLKGKVIDVAEKGYFHHDAVLRYAKVIVAQ